MLPAVSYFCLPPRLVDKSKITEQYDNGCKGEAACKSLGREYKAPGKQLGSQDYGEWVGKARDSQERLNTGGNMRAGDVAQLG